MIFVSWIKKEALKKVDHVWPSKSGISELLTTGITEYEEFVISSR